jgi:hypothetical protein
LTNLKKHAVAHEALRKEGGGGEGGGVKQCSAMKECLYVAAATTLV